MTIEQTKEVYVIRNREEQSLYCGGESALMEFTNDCLESTRYDERDAAETFAHVVADHNKIPALEIVTVRITIQELHASLLPRVVTKSP